MIGKELTAWRSRLGLSKTAASKMLGCSRNSLASWERSETAVPVFIGLACWAIENGATP